MSGSALSYPLLDSSRHLRAYYCMPQSSPDLFCNNGLFHHKTFRPLFRRLAPFPLVLDFSRPLFGVDTVSFEVVQETAHSLFFLPPSAARAPHQFSEHHALRQSRVLHARHRCREQDPPPAHNRLDGLASRCHERIRKGKRVVAAIVISSTDAASQEAMVGSAQRVVEACVGTQSEAVVQHCLEYLDS